MKKVMVQRVVFFVIFICGTFLKGERVALYDLGSTSAKFTLVEIDREKGEL